MKKTSYIKKVLLQVIIVTTVLLIASCSKSQKPEDTKDVTEEYNYAKFDNNEQKKDAQFFVNAAEINGTTSVCAQKITKGFNCTC